MQSTGLNEVKMKTLQLANKAKPYINDIVGT